MERPLSISFRHMDPSPALEERIREKAGLLEKHFDHITGCRVVISEEGNQHQQGKLFNVRVMVDVPGKEIVADKTGRHNHAHEDAYTAVNDAFRAAIRQLEDYVRGLKHNGRGH